MRVAVLTIGVVLLAVFLASFFLGQVWTVLRYLLRATARDALVSSLSAGPTLRAEVFGSAFVYLCGGVASGCLLVGLGLTGRFAAIPAMVGIGLVRWITIATAIIRSAHRLRSADSRRRAVRPDRLPRQKTSLAIFGCGISVIIVEQARFEDSWSQDWRIAVAAGIAVASLVALLFEVPKERPMSRRYVVLATTLLGGPLTLLMAGTMQLTSWEQAVLTEAGVGLTLVGIIDVLIRSSEKYRRLTDTAELDAAQRSLDEAADGLLFAEERAMRNMVDLRLVHDPAPRDAHLIHLRELVTAARSEMEQTAVDARLDQRAERRAQLRSRVDELLPALAAEYGLIDEEYRSAYARFANEIVDSSRDIDASVAEVELRAAARILVIKKTAHQLRQR